MYIKLVIAQDCEDMSIYCVLTVAKDSVRVITTRVLPLLVVNVRNYNCSREMKKLKILRIQRQTRNIYSMLFVRMNVLSCRES